MEHRLLPPSVRAEFRDVMSRVAAAVFVITATHANGGPCGLTATSVTSHSDMPPSISFNVALAARSHEPVVSARALGVHLLALGQHEAATTFAATVDDKFATVGWDYDEGVPRLRGCLAFLLCEPAAVFRHGDHSIVVAEVLRADLGRGLPLVYTRRRFGWRLF
jgi:flavin reductase (DIM6/NTAB) family NADH-FMN oxidoreductase RutF